MAKKGIKKKPRDFILDCSVTMAWYFKDEANAYANTVRRALSAARAVVPALWPLEVANILVLGERRRRSTEAHATKWLNYLQMLPIHVDGPAQCNLLDASAPSGYGKSRVAPTEKRNL
jgi:predicted nucleic acid-binding protein